MRAIVCGESGPPLRERSVKDREWALGVSLCGVTHSVRRFDTLHFRRLILHLYGPINSDIAICSELGSYKPNCIYRG